MRIEFFFQSHKSIKADKMKEEKDEEKIFEWLTVEITLINGS